MVIVCLLGPQHLLSQNENGHNLNELHETGKHHLALFLGNTHNDGINAVSVGIDYNYRWHPNLAVGLLLDHAAGSLDETLLALTASCHPISKLEVLVGAGPEFTEEGTELAFRIGLLHEFELGSITISPVANLDLVNGKDVWVLGFTVGRWFGH